MICLPQNDLSVKLKKKKVFKICISSCHEGYIEGMQRVRNCEDGFGMLFSRCSQCLYHILTPLCMVPCTRSPFLAPHDPGHHIPHHIPVMVSGNEDKYNREANVV